MTELIKFGSIIAIAWSLFQMYTAGFGALDTLLQRPIHVAFAMAVAFLARPAVKGKLGIKLSAILDTVLAGGALSIIFYAVLNSQRLGTRISMVDKVYPVDIVFGLLTILLLIEAARRSCGWPLTIITSIFVAYTFAGPYIPGIFGHTGINPKRFIDLIFLSPTGIFGIPSGTSNDYIFYFVLFSAFLELSGAGQVFIDLAFKISGRMRGGPAKAAVIASSLMGMITGSAVANVVSIGVFTIPLMKRVGYKPYFAGAIEAVASTGGQIMPPIMGAAAFIIAESLGVPYSKIALAAIIPAVAYYLALYFAIDLQALKEGIKGLSKDEIPKLKATLIQKGHLLIPLVYLIYAIISGYSLMMAAFKSIILIIAVSLIRKETRMNLIKILSALKDGAQKAVSVAIPCAIAGIIVAVAIYTGLGTKVADLVSVLAGSSLFLALAIVAIVCITFGMGMPTTAAYIMGAVLMAPILKPYNLPPLVVHMFIFYFSCISTITPPVALSSYAAAGIAEAPVGKLSTTAFVLALVAFLIPFAFVYGPSLLLIGNVGEIIQSTVGVLLGSFALASAIIGYLAKKSSLIERILLLAAALMMIAPEKTSTYIGAVILVTVYLWQKWSVRNQRIAASQ